MRLAARGLWLMVAAGVWCVLVHWPALFWPAWAALAVCGEYFSEYIGVQHAN